MREEAGLSIRELAGLAKLPQGSLQRWETGSQPPRGRYFPGLVQGPVCAGFGTVAIGEPCGDVAPVPFVVIGVHLPRNTPPPRAGLVSPGK
jgi:transcriptional regulator with XRE-family HTH domain